MTILYFSLKSLHLTWFNSIWFHNDKAKHQVISVYRDEECEAWLELYVDCYVITGDEI